MIPRRHKALSRRRMLQGVFAGSTVGIGLPLLEAMVGRRAWAQSTPPTRFGVWFWGNGVKVDRWVPTSTGAGWTPNSETEPLRSLVPYVSVVSGCHIKTATHPHHSGMTGILTGMKYHQLGTVRDTIASTFAGQSVDQIAADAFDGLAPFRSLELGVTKFRGTDEGSTFQHLSHNGPNNFNASEYSARRVYERLFGVPADPQLDLVRASVLDAVGGQVSSLSRRLGHADQVRLEQHLDSIRQLERRLEAGASACTFVEPVTDIADVDGLEQIAEKNRVMSELLALALACDLTRAFSIQYSTCGSGVIFWEAGASDGLHGLCHTEGNPQPTVHAATTLTMADFAVFLQTLADTPEGDGNLLDSCSILGTTELADGYTHSNSDFPILVAGLGGGRLRGGVHYRSTNSENTSHAVLTALRGAGVDAASFGAEDGYVTSGISELEV